MTKVECVLPEGCDLFENTVFNDVRGRLYEGYRASDYENPIVQISVMESCQNSVRGMNVHIQRHDYVLVLNGTLLLGLIDLRKDKATFGQSFLVTLGASSALSCHIPPGVGHGFCFTEKTNYIVGFSSYWDASDEICFAYDDPTVDINWGISNPVRSEKDTYHVISFSEAVEEYAKRSALLS